MSVHELSTPRLRLRRWELSDAPAALAIYGDPEVQRQLRTDGRRIHDEEEMRRALQEFISRAPNGLDRGELAIVLKQIELPIGGINWCPIESPSKSGLHAIEMSWMLNRQFWGHGYGTEAVLSLLRALALAIDQPIEVVSVCFPKNQRAFALAHKIGMHMAGMSMTSMGVNVAVFHKVLPPAVALKVA